MNHISKATKFADCPRCGGTPEFDEEGGQYTCFFCCNDGVVPVAVAEAYYQACRDFDEQFAPKLLGIYVRRVHPDDEMDFDQEFLPRAGHRLFTRLIPAPRPVRQQPALECCDDDIPF